MGSINEADVSNSSYVLDFGTTKVNAGRLTFRDFGRITQAFRERIIQSAMEAAKNYPGADKDRVYRIAVKEAANYSFSDEESMQAMMMNFDCVMDLIFLSIKKENPKFTQDKVDQIVTESMSKDPSVFNRILERIFYESGLGAMTPTEGEDKSLKGDEKS